jgi:epsin
MNNLPTLNNIKDTFINTISRNKEILTGVVTGASEATKLVVTATNNEQWGPTGPQMRQISDLTFNYTDCSQIMESIWERLSTDINFGANWRNIYKTLLLLDYVIRNGSERVVNEARQNIYQLKALSTVHFIDSEGTDRGVSIRERSKQVVELLGDTVRLREERKKCKQNRDKYSTAYGSESYESRYHSGRGGSTWDDEDLGYSPRRTYPGHNPHFDVTEDDFKDDFEQGPKRSVSAAKQPAAKPDDDFEPFVEPTRPAQKPQTQQPTWDPFEGTKGNTGNTGQTTVDDWEDFNPRGAPPAANAWPQQPSTSQPNFNPPAVVNPFGIGAPIISNPTNPVISNPTNPVISNPSNSVISNPPNTGISTAPITSTIPSNLFVSQFNSNTPSNPQFNTNTPSTTLETPKNNPPQISPSKPNDPWANSHLFSSLSSPPKTISAGTTSAKPLGATVGPGWGIATPPTTTTVPVTYATYPVNTGTYPVTYTTYPPSGTTSMFTSTPSYNNNTTWGM